MLRAAVALVLAAVLLAGCGASAQRTEDTASITAIQPVGLKSTGKAVIVFSSSYAITGIFGKTDSALKLTFAKATDGAVEAIANGANSKSDNDRAHPAVKTVEAGVMSLKSFMLMQMGKPQFMNSSAILGIPMANIQAAPGQIVYVGHLPAPAGAITSPGGASRFPSG